LGEQVPLVRGKLAGDDPHRHVDVVRACAASKPIELIGNVIGILSSQRRCGFKGRDGTMAGLARRYAALCVPKGNQERCPICLSRIGAA
jgi:hypothetical protein